MVKVTSGGETFYMDSNEKTNLDAIKGKVLKDWDMCFVVDGVEGSGKSTKTFQIAKYLSPNFSIEHICQNPQDFMEKIKRHNFLKQGDSIVLDEGFFINTRSSLTELNRQFLSILSECRQKNLFIFIVAPSFFDLDKNIALWRSRGLFHIYHDKMERGYFRYYNYEKKKYLYISGKKFYNYSKAKWSFAGRFTKFMPIDEKEYRKRKLKAFENRNPITRSGQRLTNQRDILVRYLYQKCHVKQKDIGKMLGITAEAVCTINAGV